MPPELISKNRKLFIRQSPLVENADEVTYLTADAASGASTITVKNINKFAVNKILLIGELGAEDSEIIKTHASSAPSGTTITLVTTLARAHSAGTRVFMIAYDQVELSNATTATGSKTTLTTSIGSGLVALEADDLVLVYDETEYTSGYYFARFKDSIGATFGSYCDAVPYGGLTLNTVAYAIDVALKRNMLKDFNEKVTREFCFEEVNACLDFIQGKQVRWPQHYSLNYILGQTSLGVYSWTLPSDIYDPMTNKSILGVRDGNGSNLTYKDSIEWEHDVIGRISVTTTRSSTSAGATSLPLSNSYDFDSSGSVDVFVSNTKYTITYTGVTRDTASGGTGALTGVPASGTGAVTVTIPSGTNVFQGEQEGAPLYFTVRNGSLEVSPMTDDSHKHKNVFLDYSTVATRVDSDGDALDTERSDMVKDWLTWKIRAVQENNGKLNMEDGDFLQFKEKLNDAIRTKRSGTKHKYKPKVNTIRY